MRTECSLAGNMADQVYFILASSSKIKCTGKIDHAVLTFCRCSEDYSHQASSTLSHCERKDEGTKYVLIGRLNLPNIVSRKT